MPEILTGLNHRNLGAASMCTVGHIDQRGPIAQELFGQPRLWIREEADLCNVQRLDPGSI
jgi:hypothetical protein